MTGKSIIAIVALLFASVLTVSACVPVIGAKADVRRYRVTVTIETPEGDKTGSAVREASYYSEKSILPEQGGAFYRVRKAQAAVIDLGQRGLAFALFGDDYDEAVNVFKMDAQPGTSKVITNCDYPFFVYFSDTNKSTSIKEVFKPESPPPLRDRSACKTVDHFEEFFGKGVRLKSIEYSMVNSDTPITSDIEKYIPWISHLDAEADVRRSVAENYFINSLSRGIK